MISRDRPPSDFIYHARLAPALNLQCRWLFWPSLCTLTKLPSIHTAIKDKLPAIHRDGRNVRRRLQKSIREVCSCDWANPPHSRGWALRSRLAMSIAASGQETALPKHCLYINSCECKIIPGKIRSDVFSEQFVTSCSWLDLERQQRAVRKFTYRRRRTFRVRNQDQKETNNGIRLYSSFKSSSSHFSSTDLPTNRPQPEKLAPRPSMLLLARLRSKLATP